MLKKLKTPNLNLSNTHKDGSMLEDGKTQQVAIPIQGQAIQHQPNPAKLQEQCRFLQKITQSSNLANSQCTELETKIFSNVDNLKDGRLVTIRLKPEQVSEATHLFKALNNPHFATSQEINAMFATLTMHGIVSKNQDAKVSQMITQNMAVFLSKHIQKIFLKSIEVEIITKHVFFPTVSEFIEIHDQRKAKYDWTIEKAKTIITQSLDYYNKTHGVKQP